MGFKWLGAILIITSCSGYGFSIAARKRKEEQMLIQLQGILQILESELRYRLTPLPDLCRIAAGEVRGILQTVFLKLYQELSYQKLPDAGSCMAAAIGKSGEMPASVRRLLAQLGYMLGRFDLEGQLQGLQLIRSRCGESLKKIQMNREERLRSYQTLGICAGAALAVILL